MTTAADLKGPTDARVAAATFGAAGTGTNRGPAQVGAGDRVPDRGSPASGEALPLTTAADLKGPADARVAATTFGAAGAAEVPAQGSTREVFAMDVRNISSSVRIAGAPLESGGEAPAPADPASGEAEPLLWGARETPDDQRLAPGTVPGEGLAAGAVWAEAAEPFSLTSRGGLTREVSALAGTGLLASTGYVLLNTRAGIWLLSVLTAKPLWREFDPLEVLYAWEKKENGAENEGGETLLSLVR